MLRSTLSPEFWMSTLSLNHTGSSPIHGDGVWLPKGKANRQPKTSKWSSARESSEMSASGCAEPTTYRPASEFVSVKVVLNRPDWLAETRHVRTTPRSRSQSTTVVRGLLLLPRSRMDWVPAAYLLGPSMRTRVVYDLRTRRLNRRVSLPNAFMAPTSTEYGLSLATVLFHTSVLPFTSSSPRSVCSPRDRKNVMGGVPLLVVSGSSQCSPSSTSTSSRRLSWKTGGKVPWSQSSPLPSESTQPAKHAQLPA
mmetsp:Transcript_20702/g.51743  ORF Transcript_20702/g.51743 Transcript_20702/m.51743 type:complete len:252 (-) Transcript_20702:134-889(-)